MGQDIMVSGSGMGCQGLCYQWLWDRGDATQKFSWILESHHLEEGDRSRAKLLLGLGPSCLLRLYVGTGDL